MPRIYSPNEDHNYTPGAVDFINGATAVSVTADTNWFASNGYAIDSSKHVLTPWDLLTVTALLTVCAYLAITPDADATKQELVRAIETSLSSKYLAAVTVASTAGATAGTSDIAITGAGTYKYKTGATTAPALLFKDVPDETWLDIETGDDIAPMTAGDDKITVVKIDDDGYVIGLGSDDLTLNEGT